MLVSGVELVEMVSLWYGDGSASGWRGGGDSGTSNAGGEVKKIAFEVVTLCQHSFSPCDLYNTQK